MEEKQSWKAYWWVAEINSGLKLNFFVDFD